MDNLVEPGTNRVHFLDISHFYHDGVNPVDT